VEEAPLHGHAGGERWSRRRASTSSLFIITARGDWAAIPRRGLRGPRATSQVGGTNPRETRPGRARPRRRPSSGR
jgi:hypothetical protein